MKNALRKLVLVAVLGSGAAFAQVQVSASLNLPLPTIRFETPPPLVVVQPGVQVVRDYDDEVFLTNGSYWCRRDGHWFRARDDRRWAWAPVEERFVPAGVYRTHPGYYRHWHPVGAQPVQVGFRPAPPPPRPVYVAPPPPQPVYESHEDHEWREHEREKEWKHREHEREKERRREEHAERKEDQREWKEHHKEWKEHEREEHRPADHGDDDHDRDHNHDH